MQMYQGETRAGPFAIPPVASSIVSYGGAGKGLIVSVSQVTP